MEIVIGQRWVSHTEQNLGLGIISDVSGRLITIDFPAAEEQRTYARDNAPISRIEYAVGDHISNEVGEQFTVVEVLNEKGLMGYLCLDSEQTEIVVPEVALDSHVHFTTPRQRLLSGQFDGNSAFRLRIQTLELLDRIQRSEISGLSGGRMELLPHQIYIAHEVAKRYAPRVLLADEVGLGKTIEAAMIIHHQLLTHQVKRVLILVPESLMHQWLVELLRRFNLRFALFNEDRLESFLSIDEATGLEDENPFDSEQLVISSLETIKHDSRYEGWLSDSNWDLLVVDEAHHLEWSEEKPSTEYLQVEQLAEKTRAILLLTATPEQVGVSGHFARLRLLDPQRYSDLEQFISEEQDYKALNNALTIIEQGDLEQQQLFLALADCLPESLYKKLQQIDSTDHQHLSQHLLDLHGTGRVLFRNQRNHIKGFPKRILHPYPLQKPESWAAIEQIDQSLFPETLLDDENWLDNDPRIVWLVDFLKENKKLKVLVICHHDHSAMALDKHLNLRHGIRTTSFYPELSIIERDRAAAYFADKEVGAQALICSEIGSEGRNFQIAHHLVLFDLPLNPDLIEQRIGRLDRIGQSSDINIHIPMIESSAQQTLFRWYHEGLDLFNQTAGAGFSIYKHFETELNEQLLQNDGRFDRLLQNTAEYRIELNQKLLEGRDPLLERNSCNTELAAELIEQIKQHQSSDELQGYMQLLFNEYGVESEEHSAGSLIIRPSEQMRDSHFPGLKDDGQTITFGREIAIEREDFEFMSWEHPMVNESMEAILYGDLGNAAVATIKVSGLKPGTVLLESCYTIATSAPKTLRLNKHLPLQPLRLLTDLRGKDLSSVVNHQAMNQLARKIPKELAKQASQQLRSQIDQLITGSQSLAAEHLQKRINLAIESVNNSLDEEISRMTILAKLNPNVRQSEIEHLKGCKSDSIDAINRAEMQLQAIRLLISQ